jgi:hypothetical protein
MSLKDDFFLLFHISKAFFKTNKKNINNINIINEIIINSNVSKPELTPAGKPSLTEIFFIMSIVIVIKENENNK